MSNRGCEAGGRMKKGYCPVTLEPELEAEACLWTPAQRRAAAKKMRRWARQLDVSAVILERLLAPRPKPALKGVPRRKLALN